MRWPSRRGRYHGYRRGKDLLKRRRTMRGSRTDADAGDLPDVGRELWHRGAGLRATAIQCHLYVIPVSVYIADK
ncbi:hypothetical protein GCM10029978_066480 [Actinoallomurus acanthiterrae]